jgi:hypothetical protein
MSRPERGERVWSVGVVVSAILASLIVVVVVVVRCDDVGGFACDGYSSIDSLVVSETLSETSILNAVDV